MTGSPQPGGGEVSTTASGDATDEESEICCNACGFEASFVPEGMLPCERCSDVHYCSIECLQWDWKSGGHDKTCIDKRPSEESESSEDPPGSASMDFLAGVASAGKSAKQQQQQRHAISASFDSDEASMVSMDMANLFGIAPSSSAGSSSTRSSKAGGTISASPGRGNASPVLNNVEPQADVQGKKGFWEAKSKSNTVVEAESPRSPTKKNTSKLAAFFESQSPKTPEKHPAQLSPSKKKNMSGGILSSFGGGGATNNKNANNNNNLGSNDDDDDSMGEDDFGYAMGQHVVDNPMDESFDFMDKSVQTSGLKSIVEEGDSWTAEEPDLEGSWRSRTPFEVEVEVDEEAMQQQQQQKSSQQSKHKPPASKSQQPQQQQKQQQSQQKKKNPALHTNMTNMLGYEDDDDEEESLWDAPAASSSKRQQTNYVEPDDEETYEEEEVSIDVEEEEEEEEVVEDEEMEDEYEEEYEDEQEYEGEYDEEQYENGEQYETEEEYEEETAASEIEQSHTEEDTTIDNSERTPDESNINESSQSSKRKLPADSHLTASFRLQKKTTPTKTSYANKYTLNLSSHSEPANQKKEGSARRRSMGGDSAASSRGAASLLDFRQLYSDRSKPNPDKDIDASSRLKDFREAYNGSQEDSITSNDGDESAPTKEVNPNHSSSNSLNTDASGQSRKSVNQALKTSINKALRDFEKLYGTEAAMAAVARLTQAVGDDTTSGQESTTKAVVEAVVSDQNGAKPAASGQTVKTSAKRGLLDPPKTPKNPKRREEMERTLSPSSWAMPSEMSVSTNETQEKPLQMPPGFGGKYPRSQSMPMVGGCDPPQAQLKRENSFSSWGYTGMSIASGGNKSEGTPPPPVSQQPATVAEASERSADYSEQSELGAMHNVTSAPEQQNDPRGKEMRSSWAFNSISLQALGLGWNRKTPEKNDDSKGSAGVSNPRSNHTQESNAASSWAHGFSASNIKTDDDYQIAKQKGQAKDDSQSSEQWLADLASSSQIREVESQKPVVQTVSNSSDEESVMVPVPDEDMKQADNHLEEESLGDPFENQDSGDAGEEAEESIGDPPDKQGENEEAEVSEHAAENQPQKACSEEEDKDDDSAASSGAAEQTHLVENQPQEQLAHVSRVPRYTQYRDTLAKNNYGKDTARTIDFDQSVSIDKTDSGEQKVPSIGAVSTEGSKDSSRGARNLTYRSSLATTPSSQGTPDIADGVDEVPTENGENHVARNINTLSAVPSGGSGSSRFQQYRSTLAKRVHPKQAESDFESMKRAKTSRVLAPADASNSSTAAPRYQKYRSLLAKKVVATGPENTANTFDDPAVDNIKKNGNSSAPIGNASKAPTNDAGRAGPRYQQYRSALAQNVSVGEAPAPGKQDVVPSESSNLQKQGPLALVSLSAPEAAPAPVVVATANDGPTPRYAKHRTGLADRLSTSTRADTSRSVSMESSEVGSERGTMNRAIGLDGSTPVATAQKVGGQSDQNVEHEVDEAFKAQLSNFLAKSEKGKKPDFDTEEVLQPKKKASHRDLVENQSRRIAEALASSSQFLGRQQAVTEEPKESRLQIENEPRKMDDEMSSNRRVSDQAVAVNCISNDKDIENGRRNRQKDLEEPTPSESAELGRKLYLRNQCYAYGLLICLLVAMPLGIGLGIGLTREKDKGLPIYLTSSPTASPDRGGLILPGSLSPTTSPGIRGTVAPTSYPSPTSATSGPTPISASDGTAMPTMPPAPVPTLSQTLAPTAQNETDTNPVAPPTPAPSSTSAPTFVDEELFNLLSSVSFDSGDNIQTAGTPQNLAYTWLAGTDSLASLSTERRIQRYALATLYFSTDGPSWSQTLGWLSEEDECSWFSTGSGTATCDANDAFVTLDLGFNGLMGTLPPEIGLLTGLTRVDLSGGVGPGIGGSLPTQLSLLTELEIFTIHDNAITGQLFSEISALLNLRILSVRDNEMTGVLPDEIGELSRLSFMDVSFNGFSGAVPDSIGRLDELVTLNLGNNAFTSLPSAIGSLTSLGSLKAPSNSLSGPLFQDWGGLVNLQDLDLSSNSLSGPLPASLGQLGGLLELDLSNNLFDSPIPPSFGGLTSILILRLNSNQLRGSVPPVLGDLQFVTEIRIDDNNLEGSVPNQVCNTFEVNSPKFFLDCAGPAAEVTCPPGLCCTYCCDDNLGCECVFANTQWAYLC